MPSREWDYFMENFFGDPYMMWHDGIDPSAANDLKGEERAKAEEMLIESMKEGSYWAPMGLREIKSQTAIPVMKEMIDDAHGRLMIEIAHALNTLENTTDFLSYIIDMLDRHYFWTVRMDAARMLRNYNTPDVIEALFGSVQDADYLVRNHSSESLLHIHGLPASISEYKEIFKEIIVEYDSNDEESIKEARIHYKKAAQMLRDLITNK
ncbi:MAG: HEAT repeat domain-containing protein [Candidatus Thorarchaeota archaeon]|jgi:HEAT repeat protein